MKKTVLLGVTSSIAVYKAVQLTSDLLKKGYDVEVIMSKNATEFVTPLTFSTLTKHNTIVDTFERVVNYDVEHISLAKKADVFAIIPATANIIAKVANGICDDMLSTTFLACEAPKIIAPAMNTAMYNNPITQNNINKCKEYGMKIVEPASGLLACGDSGKGKLADIDTLIEAIEEALYVDKPLMGKHLLVSAGPTKEAIDPVRYITNHSSGKMGYSIARAARNMGAKVTLVSGEVELKEPYDIEVVKVKSANDMFEALTSRFDKADGVIMSAAVADFTPLNVSDQKIKKKADGLCLELTKTKDILKTLGEMKTTQKICGFAMETENVIENAKNKCISKNCDLLVVNDLNEKGAGFKKDTNVVSIITKDNIKKLELMKKEDLAYEILKEMFKCY